MTAAHGQAHAAAIAVAAQQGLRVERAELIGGEHDADLLERCLLRQAVFLGALLYERAPHSPEARRRLDWLRNRA